MLYSYCYSLHVPTVYAILLTILRCCHTSMPESVRPDATKTKPMNNANKQTLPQATTRSPIPLLSQQPDPNPHSPKQGT